MSAADDRLDFGEIVPQGAAVPPPLACEVCGRELGKLRVGPTIRSGWRCARPACAPRRDEGAHHGALVNALITTTTATKKSRCSDGT